MAISGNLNDILWFTGTISILFIIFAGFSYGLYELFHSNTTMKLESKSDAEHFCIILAVILIVIGVILGIFTLICLCKKYWKRKQGGQEINNVHQANMNEDGMGLINKTQGDDGDERLIIGYY